MASEIHQLKAAEGSARDLRIDTPSMPTNCNLRDGSTSDVTSCISSGDATSSSKESEVYPEALTAEQGMYYPVNELYGYYYQGSDGYHGESDAQSYFAQTDGSEIRHSTSQADNGSAIYYFPGFQSEYTPYSVLYPGGTNNADGQYLGRQLYYPNAMFSQPYAPPGPQSVAYGPEFIPAYSWDSSLLFGDGLYSEYGGNPTFSVTKPNFSSQIRAHPHSKTLSPSKTTATEKKGSWPSLDVSSNPATQNQSLKHINKATSVLSEGFLPINKVASYSHRRNSGPLYPPSTTNIKETGRSCVGTDKLKSRNMTHASSNSDVLNEQNHGPRTNGNGARSTWNPEAGLAEPLGAECNNNSGTSSPLVRKEDYNLPDFPTKSEYALFFVIKSYSEDDIHKSIKYNVWASTPNGNKRLDNAFQVAQEKMAENGGKCPVFLFFSVNASGQFCGVAEMIGRVDFSKNMDFWQQDKWTGCFPVKWHIIKDIPNPQFRHIILENNENKPVTNSRDTQEVRFRQGTEMLNIFKNYSSKTSILDDFSFYENRQKAMQDRRIKQPTPILEHLSSKTGDDAQDMESIVSSLQSIELEASHRMEQLPSGGMLEG